MTSPRIVQHLIEAGTADNGRRLHFAIHFQDQSVEAFEMPHKRIAEFIGKPCFFADVAHHARLEIAGHQQRTEPIGVLDTLDLRAQASGIEPVVVLRATIAKNVYLGLRIPFGQVQAAVSRLPAAGPASGAHH